MNKFFEGVKKMATDFQDKIIGVKEKSQADRENNKTLKSWKIKLDNENKPTVTITKEGEDEKDYSEVYGEVIPEVNGRYITYRYYFKNFPMDDSYYLPETGGRGTSTTTGIGVVLLLASAFLFYRNKKRTKTFYHYN